MRSEEAHVTAADIRESLDKLSDTALAIKADRDALLAAAKGIFAQIEQGNLVRDVSHDHEVGWAMRHIPMVQAIARLAEAIKKCEERP